MQHSAEIVRHGLKMCGMVPKMSGRVPKMWGIVLKMCDMVP